MIVKIDIEKLKTAPIHLGLTAFAKRCTEDKIFYVYEKYYKHPVHTTKIALIYENEKNYWVYIPEDYLIKFEKENKLLEKLIYISGSPGIKDPELIRSKLQDGTLTPWKEQEHSRA